MKRKSIILLSSILAGSLLVGGAFAAYAVTDNADPFGINVTPGNLDEDDTTYVTLEWGQGTSLAGVGNIQVGENRKAGVVNLVAKSNEAYLGKFELKIKDVTTAEKGTTDPYLIDYLNVRVYEGDLSLKSDGSLPDVPEDTTLYKIDKSAGTELDPTRGALGEKLLPIDVLGTNSGKKLSIFVYIDNSVTAPQYSKMLQDKVELRVDWKAYDSSHEATENVVYFVKPNTTLTDNWDNVYAYAWKTASEVNEAWPGVKMVQHNGNVYKISVPANYVNIVFNNGKSGADERKTIDLTVPSPSAGTPCYDYTLLSPAWGQVPALKDYYLIGALNGASWANVATHKFGINPQNTTEYVLEGVELKKDDELKVAYGYVDEDVLIVGEDGYFPANADKKFKVPADGTYSFYFTPTYREDWDETSYGSQKGFAGYLWVVPQEESEEIDKDDKLELTVTLHGYSADNAAVFIHYWGSEIVGDALVKDGKATIHKAFTHVQVVRMPAGSTSVDYASAWNSSSDIARDGEKTTLVESTEDFGVFSFQ